MLVLGAMALSMFSCKKIHHRIGDDMSYSDSQVVSDTTLVPVTMHFPEVRFTQKEFFSAYLESNAITSRIISLIDATAEGAEIYISMYQLNQTAVLEALKRADGRGVNLRVLLDMSRVESQRVNPAAFNYLRSADLKNTELWDTNNDITAAALNENKFILFSEIETDAGKKQHIVVQTSQNLTDADSRYVQDAVILADGELYTAYLAYWNELKNRAVSGMTGYNYSSAVVDGGKTEAYFLPYRNNGAAISGDVILDILNRISNPSIAEIRIAMAWWDNSRISILNKLVQLADQGAKVELVLKSNLSATLSQFESLESKGGTLRIMNVSDNNRPLTNMESRFTLIKGTFDGVNNAKVVVTGGLSFTGNSLQNSNSAELLLKNDEIYDQYESLFSDLMALPEYRTGGRIYQGFPETFEPINAADINKFYTPETILQLATGDWKINQSGLRNESAADKIVSPTHAWRSNFNVNTPIYLAMNFDVPDGASKVSFYYGTWGNQSGTSLVGAACTFALEYSTDQGATWTQIGNPVTEAAWTAKQLTYEVDIDGPVRFRINRKGQATNGAGNGRLNIDDFAVYRKP